MSSDQPVIRPGTIVLTLILMGIGALFAALCAAYIYSYATGHAPAPQPPWIFVFNIPILILATWALSRCRVAFHNRRTAQLSRLLLLSLTLTIVFTILQAAGWIAMHRNIPLTQLGPFGYLFLLSVLHVLHVLAGIPFLIWFIWQYKPGDVLRYTPERETYLRGLIRYWHFLDILWILLVLILWIGAVLTRG